MTPLSSWRPPRAGKRRRAAMAFATALIMIALGLGLRFHGLGLGLPAFIVKYGGSVLWATMVHLLLVALLPLMSWRLIGGLAIAIAAIVEASRLIHTPWLDSFRLTLAGALLLGRIFSLWNIAAYVVGVVIGIWIDRCATRPAAA
ncbi:DUF2809 domain-containing protein [Bradyrhizobium oligotrophicum]|uniref:ribosomal maturation YjgA family protein n=1 Tax=Bradyrhizobium TaxID=374 RepID=UPI003966A700